jgi:predicted Zn finger-like uncharacterized protein
MKFVCDRCQTKYSIADDKVRGKVLKVRCKTCQNVITVREVGAKPSQSALAPVRSSQRPSGPHSAPIATLGDSHDELSERTSIAAMPAALMADLAHGRRPTPPPPPPLGDGIEWFLALEGAQQGPFTRKLLVDRLLALPKDADVHVWNDRMDGWKPPKDVPNVAHDLAARRAPALPVRPPIPRVTPSPPLPPMAARRGTQPLTSGVGSKLPLPGPHLNASVAHAVPAPHPFGALEDAATPPPLAAHGALLPAAGAKTNGVTAHASSPAAAFPGGESDALSALNLGGAVARPAAPPRIMEAGEATAWSGAGRVQEGRHGNTKMGLGLLLVVGVIVAVIALNMTHKAPVVTAAPTQRAGLDSESLAKLGEIAAKQKEEPPPPIPPGVRPGMNAGPPVADNTGRGAKGKDGRGRGSARGRQAAPRIGSSPLAVVPKGPGAAPAEDPNASRFREQAGRNVIPTAPVSNRPAPNQAEIARVIANNKAGIKTCYQRALLRDSSLTHGKIVVGVTIGISGRVKKVTVDGPSSFRVLEPCIREMLQRWVFPQSYEEYGTEFSYLFQGNE